MTKRIKISGPSIKNRDQAIAAVSEIRELTISRNKAALAREAELKKVDDQFAPQIDQLDQKIKIHSELVANWADANPDEFGKAKSLDLIHGVVGWRVGNYKLAKKTKKKWDDLVDTVKSVLGARFIRTSAEVNKEGIIAGFKAGTVDPLGLKACKLEVVQDEAFFIEPKIEEIETRVVTEAK